MDRKSVIVLVASFLLLLLWVPLVNKIWPPQPVPRSTNEISAATNGPTQPTNAVPPAAAQTPSPAAAPSQPLVLPGTPEQTAIIDSEDALYTFTSHGGGLKEVALKSYPAVVTCESGPPPPTNQVRLNAGGALPVMAVLGGEAVQGDGVFTLTQTSNRVTAVKELTNGLRLVKQFELRSNYLVHATVRLENRGSQPLPLPAQQWVLGTATAFDAHDDPSRLGASWYNGSEKETVDQGWFANRTLGCFPGTPRSEYLVGASNVVWGDVHSQFFTLAVVPEQPAAQFRVVMTNVVAELTNAPAAAGQSPPPPIGFLASFVYPAAKLAPGESIERQFHLYAGPKEYKILARLGSQFKNNLHLIMDYEGFFGWFAQVLLSSMNGLSALGLSYGLAIIVITIVIKLLFWPLTNASTKSMKRMAALQPQMKALQEKYKDDPAKMNRKLMEFMKENKVSPLGGCLPMLLQIPVFFGFFKMIQSAIELRGARFLWACDLSKPDTLFVIPGLNFPVNPLPLLMGVTMLWQARLTPPSPGMDPLQQKLMRYMPLMFLFILYNFSAGLTLYWTVQNLLTIAQMKLTRTSDDQAKSATTAAKPAPESPPRKKKK